jgi:toxin ParE1/3/4
MPDTYRIKYTRQAADQLEGVFAYIERDSPENARKLIGRILDAIESLDLFPHRFASARGAEPLGQNIRSMPVGSYLVRYHIDDHTHTVTVLSVRHGARESDR